LEKSSHFPALEGQSRIKGMIALAARAFVLLALAGALTVAAADPGREGEVVARGPVTSLPLPRFVSVRAETANVRRGPSLSHRVDWSFTRRGMPLEVTAEYGQWRRVRDADGAGGWVHHSLLSGVRTVLVQAGAMVPLYAGTSETTAIRAYIEPGAVARLEKCSQQWCLIGADGLQGWAARDVLWGVGPEDDE